MFDSFPDFKLYLMSGTGNSFAITNFMSQENTTHLAQLFDQKNLSLLAQKICQLTQVDGFIVITEACKKQNDYRWIFFNADGSPAEMCGNAARCVGHLCFKNHLAGQEHSFESEAGDISIFVDCEAEVQVTMPKIKNFNPHRESSSNDIKYTYRYLNTGVPHCVFKLKKFEDHKKNIPLAKKIRALTDSHPDGSNVTFYYPLSATAIQSVSFERGVEDFTLACGTGAVAAAYCHSQETQAKKVEVQMPGGTVMVDFSTDSPYLIGPVSYNSTLFADDIEELWTNSYTD